MTKETYINTPLPPDVAKALRERAKKNGRRPSRELSQIAIRALQRRAKGAAK